MFNIILFGPPGSGKGTQSINLINEYGLNHISTGDLLRAEVSKKTELGLQAKELIDDGKLVPDQVVIGMINSYMENNPKAKGFIFDGFPRTVKQAETLDILLQDKGNAIQVLLSLEVPEEEIKRRLLERGQISGRSDDNIEVIEKRVKEYYDKTKSVESYYQEKGKLRKIKGDGTIEETFELLKIEIESLGQKI